jgi:hypothetical protein
MAQAPAQAMARSITHRFYFARRAIMLGVVALCLSTGALSAQTIRPFAIQWSKTFGGANAEIPGRVAVVPSQGYAVLGESQSGISGNKLTPNHGSSDAWLVRVDSMGNKVWELTVGGTLGERPRDLKRCASGGWVFVGESSSQPTGNKTSPNYGQADYWIVRVDDVGNKLWDRSFGGSSYDEAVTVIEVAGGDFVVGGYSHSGTNEVKTVGNFGSADTWILRLDAQGSIIWQTNYGTATQDRPYAMDRYGTNGFVIAGASGIGGGEGGSSDFWIFAIDHEGKKLWDRAYGGDGTDEAFNIRQTIDGGFIALGWTTSGVSGNKTTPLVYPSFDFWLIRLDSLGNKVWEQTFGHPGSDFPSGLAQTIDGGFVLTGGSVAVGGWVLRLDQNGNQVWEHNVGNTTITDIQATSDGGSIGTGHETSNGMDIRVMKLAPDALTAPELELRHPWLTGAEPVRQLVVRGIPGRTYVLERTEDLLSWLPFATNTLSSNSVELIDRSSNWRSFYRAMMVP